MKEKSFISVVFYLRNYESLLQPFLEAIMDTFRNNFDHFEIICVNNDSTDNSIGKLKEIYEKNNYEIPLNIVNMSYCRSRDEAMSAGIDLAIGDFIYSFESMLIDYNVEKIMNVYYKALNGNDVVFVCQNKKIAFKQRLYYGIYNFGVKKDKRIYPERFKLFTRRAINRVENISNYLPNNMPSLKASGLKTKVLFFKPSKLLVKYDKTEYDERLSKAFESIILYTTSIPLILFYLSMILLALSIIFLVNSYLLFGLFCIITSFISISVAIITYYLHIQLSMYLKNNVHLIKDIEKVVKQ